MITSDYVRLMARYTSWQNGSLYGAAGGLPDAERRRDRGAFFRSIHETLAHVLWADELWLSRFTDYAAPDGGIGQSTSGFSDWTSLSDARTTLDAFISQWAMNLTDDDLAGDLTWYSGAMGREITKPRALLVTHFFNHGTHHRGQVHAMLTAAGARPADTDLPFMPATAS